MNTHLNQTATESDLDRIARRRVGARMGWYAHALVFLAVNTFYGGFLSIRDNYWPRTASPVPSVVTEGYVLSICTVLMMILAVVILGAAFAKWASVLSNGREPLPAQS